MSPSNKTATSNQALGGATDSVRMERAGPVRVLTLNRPEKRNAANLEMQQRLLELLKQLSEDDAARAVVLTGAGGTFCAGGDRSDLLAAAEGHLANREQFVQIQSDTIRTMLAMPMPTIAALNGAAAGLGAGLAALCDFVVMGEDAMIWDPHAQYGLPGSLSLQLIWPHLTSIALAKELLMTGRKVGATEALRLGLANRVCPTGQEFSTAMELADLFAHMPPRGVALTKRAFNRRLLDDFAYLCMGENE